MASVTIITDEYELAHGKKPRGDGGWAFFRHSHCSVVHEEPIWKQGTFSEAKRQAVNVARSEGVRFLYVGP